MKLLTIVIENKLIKYSLRYRCTIGLKIIDLIRMTFKESGDKAI